MRTTILTLTAVLFSASLTYGQRTLNETDDNKYSINLPSYWKKNSKAVRILGDKLPEICEELKDKELCGDDCNPGYTIEFYLTVPEALGQYISKSASDADRGINPVTGKVYITSAQLISPANAIPARVQPANYNGINGWEITTDYSFQCFLLLRDKEEKIISRLVLVDTNEVWSTKHTVTRENGAFSEQNPLIYIDKNKEKMMPTFYQLLAIADNKILNLK